jgi:formyl-CoA transferase
MEQTLAHPAVQLANMAHPAVGDLRAPGPILQAETTLEHHRAPPLLNEHRNEILGEVGFSPLEVQQLQRDGVFGRS